MNINEKPYTLIDEAVLAIRNVLPASANVLLLVHLTEGPEAGEGLLIGGGPTSDKLESAIKVALAPKPRYRVVEGGVLDTHNNELAPFGLMSAPTVCAALNGEIEAGSSELRNTFIWRKYEFAPENPKKKELKMACKKKRNSTKKK